MGSLSGKFILQSFFTIAHNIKALLSGVVLAAVQFSKDNLLFVLFDFIKKLPFG